MLKTIFETGPKTSLKWIALLRIMLGVLFLTQWYYNLMKGVYTPDGLRGSLEYFFMNSEMPLTWYKAFIDQAIIPIVGIFAPFQMIAELLIGIALLFGVLTPLVSLGAGFFILNTFLLSWSADWPWSYLIILGICGVLFSTRAGQAFGVDAYLVQRFGEKKLPLW